MKPVFDEVATEYDREFTHTLIGKAQRYMVWKYLWKTLKNKQGLEILEINCGTGEDALKLAKMGHKVLATDLSNQMVRITQTKLDRFPDCGAKTAGFGSLSPVVGNRKFDLIFSKFRRPKLCRRRNFRAIITGFFQISQTTRQAHYSYYDQEMFHGKSLLFYERK